MSKEIRTTGKSLATAPVAESSIKPSSVIIPNTSVTCKGMKLLKTTEMGVMKFSNMDAISSNTTATLMEIEHSKINRTIKSTIKDEEDRKKDNAKSGDISDEYFDATFIKYGYKDSMNRTQNGYLLNEDAFYLVLSNSRSKNAHKLKVAYKAEFNKMREERYYRKEIKEDTKAKFAAVQLIVERLKQEYPNSGHIKRLYSNTQFAVNRVITGTWAKANRDTMTTEQLIDMDELEIEVEEFILARIDNTDSRILAVQIKDFLDHHPKRNYNLKRSA